MGPGGSCKFGSLAFFVTNEIALRLKVFRKLMVGIPRMQGLQIALENVNPGSSLRFNTQWSARFWVHAAQHPITFALFRKKSLFLSAIMPKKKKLQSRRQPDGALCVPNIEL